MAQKQMNEKLNINIIKLQHPLLFLDTQFLNYETRPISSPRLLQP